MSGKADGTLKPFLLAGGGNPAGRKTWSRLRQPAWRSLLAKAFAYAGPIALPPANAAASLDPAGLATAPVPARIGPAASGKTSVAGGGEARRRAGTNVAAMDEAANLAETNAGNHFCLAQARRHLGFELSWQNSTKQSGFSGFSSLINLRKRVPAALLWAIFRALLSASPRSALDSGSGQQADPYSCPQQSWCWDAPGPGSAEKSSKRGA